MKIQITESDKKRHATAIWGEIVLPVLLVAASAGAGGALMLEELTGKVPVWPFVTGVLLAAFAAALVLAMKQSVRVSLACTFAAVAAGSVLWTDLLRGAVRLWNMAADTLGRHTSIWLPLYVLKENGRMERELIISLLFLGMAAGIAGSILLWLRLLPLLLLGGILPAVLYFWLEGTMDFRLFAVFYLGLMLETIWILECRGSADGQGRAGSFGSGALLMVCVAAVAGGIFTQMVSPSEYAASGTVQMTRREMLDQIASLRYRKGRINTLPDGRIREAGSWSASDETALSITMEQPESLYLRGFVGSVYDGNGWMAVSPETVWQERNLFWWLHQDGFYPEMQLAQAESLTEGKAAVPQGSSITVKNERADSRYLYTPYELTRLPSQSEDPSRLADSMLKAGGLWGRRSYQLEASGNLVRQFTDLAARSYQMLTEGKADTYRQEESYYNSWVYRQDTMIPADLASLFEKELGSAGVKEKGHVDYATAVRRIREYLKSAVTYQTDVQPLFGSTDVTAEFLTGSREGYSIHYATAAALMFRYYGIPSRYVEGYLITPEDVKGKQAGDTVTVSGKNGHAWTEIYVAGLGWVPVEMTPAYEQVMEEADLNVGLEAGGSRTTEIPEPETEAPEEVPSAIHWNLHLAFAGLKTVIFLLLAVFELFCLCFFLTVCLLRLLAECRRRRSFAQRDSRRALRAMAGYAGKLHAKGTFSPKTEEAWRETYHLGQKAAFSTHAISGEECRQVRACVSALKKELKQTLGWYDRWVVKYIERLW